MTDTTLKLTEAFNRHNSLYNALLGNLKTLTTARATIEKIEPHKEGEDE